MAQSLSDDEFHRMQNQLLELRTANYQLKDHSKKLESELGRLKQTSTANERELEKANKIITKSKKAKDVELLFAENDGLQLKLQSQEEDFRLQNSALMEELSKLCTSNEELEKEVEKLKKGQSVKDEVDGSPSSETKQDLRRLQAENAALQKNLASTQQRYNDELSGMRQNVNMLTQACADAEERYTRLLGERPTPTGASGDQGEGEGMEEIPISSPDGTSSDQSPAEAEINYLLNEEFEAFIEDLKLSAVTSDFDDDVEPKDPMTVLQGHAKQLKKRVSGALVRNMESFVKMVSKEEGRTSRGNSFADTGDPPCDENLARIKEQMREINDLQLRVDTEQEENRILKQQLQDSEQSYQAELVTLKEEMSKLSEKAKKKQESLVQLQNEKEELYAENRKNVEELHGSIDKEVESLKKENSELKAALNRNKQNRMEAQESSKQQIKQLENTVEELKQQTANREEVTRLEEDKAMLTNQLANIRQAYTSTSEEANRLQNISTSTKNQLESTQRELEELQLTQSVMITERDELQAQFNECLAANATLGDKLAATEKDRDSLQKELQEATKVADKRKNMLDEMAIQTQTIRKQHKEEVETMTSSHQKFLDDLRQQLQDEKLQRRELEPLKEQVTQRDAQIESLENAKGWFERRLKESEEDLVATKEKHAEDIKELEAQHQQEIEGLKKELTQKDEDHKEELSQRDEAMERSREEKAGLLETIEKLKQDAKDSVVDHKLSEKKRSGVKKITKEENVGLLESVERLKQDAKDSVIDLKLSEKKTSGSLTLKDLQRQLRQEKKRAGKLQERLQEVLTQSSQGPQGLDALFSHHTFDDRSSRHDTSSISSLSNSGTGRDYSDFAPSPNDSMSAALSEETTELISKLTSIQQENWQLEEKVRHLEESNACMAEDLLKKSAIIEAHVMERKIIDPGKAGSSQRDVKQEETKGPTLRKMRELMRSSRDVEEESQREMNQKLQIMLEETITKNMHLQQDIEMLSSEVVRLSKLVGSSQSGTPSPVDEQQGKLPGGAVSMATASSSTSSSRAVSSS